MATHFSGGVQNNTSGGYMLEYGEQGKRLVAGVAKIADAGTIDTGLSAVTAIVLTAVTADTVATVTSITGGVATVGLKTAGVAGAEQDVHYIAVGTV